MTDISQIAGLVEAVSKIGDLVGFDTPGFTKVKGVVSGALGSTARPKFDADMEAVTARRRKAHEGMLAGARGKQG